MWIPRPSRPRSSAGATAVCAALVCTATLGVLLPTLLVRGAGAGPDSATYAAAARSLAAGRGYLDVDGVSPMLDFPPACSALLAAFLRMGLDVAAAGAAVDIGCALVTAVVLVCWARRLGAGPVLTVALGAAVVLSPPLLDSDTSIMSEAPFIAECTAAAALLSTVVRAGRVRARDAALLAGLCAAAGLTRYVGLALSTAVVAGLLLVPLPWRRRLVVAGAVGVAAVLPPAGWFIRNRLVGGSFVAGDYAATRDSVWGHAADDLRGIGGWLLGTGHDTATLLAGAAALAVPAAVLVTCVVPTRWCSRGRPDRDLVAIAVLVLVQVGLLLAAQSRVGLDTDDRFMRPLAPTLALLPTILLARTRTAPIAGPALLRRQSLAAAVAVLMVGLFALHAVPAAAQRVEAGRGAGLGDYDSAAWRGSALAAALRAHHPQRILVSNDAYAVSWLTRLPVEQSPATFYDNSQIPTGQLADFDSDVADRPRLLAWFDHPDVDLLVPLPDLARTVCLQQIARYDDGQLLETCGSVPRP